MNPDGSLKWQHAEVTHQGEAGFCNSPVVDRNNNSYICNDNSFCYGFDPEGNLMWSYSVEADSGIRAQPVISEDGVMYIPAVLSLVRIEGINLNRATHLPLVQNVPSGD